MGYVRMLSVSLILSVCIVCSSFAAEVLTWEDCVRESLANHPDLAIAAEEINQVESDKDTALGSALPQVSADLSTRRSGTSFDDNSGESWSYGFSGRQLLFDGFKTSNEIAAASENVKAVHYQYAVTSSNVRLALRSAFVQLLQAQDLQELTGDIARRRRQNLELIRLRYEAGREHRGALLSAEASLIEAEFELAQAQRELSLAQTVLSKAMGRPTVQHVEVTGEFAVDDAVQIRPDFAGIADSVPFLQQLAAQSEAARFGLKSARGAWLPEVFVSSSVGDTSDSWPPEETEWSAGLGVSLPLFDGGRRRAIQDRRQAQVRKAQAQQRSGRDSVIVTLEETWAGLQDALGMVSVRRKFLDAAQERASIAQTQYSTGLIDFDDWTIIEDNLVQAKKAYLNAQSNMLLAEARWLQAKGRILENVEPR